jgi:hypothetical protein
MEALTEVFSERFFMPHGHCYLWTPALVWLQVVSNALIGLSYVVISTGLGMLVWRVRTYPSRRSTPHSACSSSAAASPISWTSG